MLTLYLFPCVSQQSQSTMLRFAPVHQSVVTGKTLKSAAEAEAEQHAMMLSSCYSFASFSQQQNHNTKHKSSAIETTAAQKISTSECHVASHSLCCSETLCHAVGSNSTSAYPGSPCIGGGTYPGIGTQPPHIRGDPLYLLRNYM